MTSSAWLWLIVNWMSLPVLMAIGGILAMRRVHREIPFFFSYVVVTVLAGLARLITQFWAPKAYFDVYWSTDLIIVVMSLVAVLELLTMRLFPGFYQIRILRYLFGLASAIVVLLGWMSAMESPNAAAAFAIEERVLSFVLLGVLVFFVLLMIVMGRQWTRSDFGIALGFAIYTAAFLVMSALWVRSRYQPTAVEELPVIAYDISALVWLGCFWSSEKPRGTVPVTANSELMRQARIWEKVLKQWLMPKKRLF